ncbi:hypothetical protein ACFWXH_11935 [Mesorhizobium sp. NPDC059054]|nr:hypothetical protein [Mesorhizobium sp. 1M-11]
MRLVIFIAAIAFFLIWDGLYNEGRYMDAGTKGISHAIAYITG